MTVIAITFSLQSLIVPSCGIASAFLRFVSVCFTNSPISASVSLM